MIQKLRGSNEKGFTLIELMIVIAIIGILAAIAIPNFVSYRKRGYNSQANADVKNAYTSAQAYFTDYAAGTVTLSKLTAYGFVQSADVITTVTAGTQGSLAIQSHHTNGDKTYSVNSSGSISN